jgi:hypothetical protein
VIVVIRAAVAAEEVSVPKKFKMRCWQNDVSKILVLSSVNILERSN